jgi:hypothetical protein
MPHSGTTLRCREVGRRITELAAESLAESHPARHAIRASEQAARAIEVAPVERLAHQRTADTLAVDEELVDLLHREAVHGPRHPQGLDRALAAPGEVEVVADHEVTRAETRDQQAVDELGGRHAPHAIVEAQYHHAVHAAGREGLSFSRRRVRRAGAAAPSKYSRGVGSNVTTTAGTPRADARSRNAAMMCWCPRCTPS